MSDNKAEAKEKAPKAAKAPKDTAAPEAGVTTVNRKEKRKWTIERCMTFARRFTSEAEWQAGAPSSYKSAGAHGWLAECLTHLNKDNVTKLKARKTNVAKPKEKKKSA